jgi:hypothetical protein
MKGRGMITVWTNERNGKGTSEKGNIKKFESGKESKGLRYKRNNSPLNFSRLSH